MCQNTSDAASNYGFFDRYSVSASDAAPSEVFRSALHLFDWQFSLFFLSDSRVHFVCDRAGKFLFTGFIQMKGNLV